jgi:UDP:flavonoid glycosyltransferase YjiC (YdhE family)
MAKRVIIWPDVYREQGHWLPCINLAKSLQTAGYQVEFMGIKDCQSVVAPYNPTAFHTILETIYPLGHSVENRLEPLDQRWKPHHVLPICRGALDSVFAPAQGSRPDLLIGGYFTALETLLIHHKYGIPIVLITTYLRHPEDKPELHAKTKLIYLPRPVVQKIMDLVTTSAAAKRSLDAFVQPLAEALELIPCPREFDFTDRDWNHREETVRYVEPMIQRAVLNPPGSPPADPVNVPADMKLIFATAGSMVQDYEDKARLLFKSLIDMMQTQAMDKYKLAMAVGERLNAQLNFEFEIPQRVYPTNTIWYDWISQLDVMKTADVVFMHGGLATIKESIWEQVPMVIIPHGKDQMDNAARVRRSRTGVVTEVADLGPTELRKLLTDATSDPVIRRSLARMRAVFAETENAPAKPSVDQIKTIVPVGP